MYFGLKLLIFLYCSQRVIEQCEHKLSKLKEDLVGTKEVLNRTCLEKDVLDQEKMEIGTLVFAQFVFSK